MAVTTKRTPGPGGGMSRLVVALKELDGLQGKTGFFETAKYADGTPVAYVATINEFGTPTQPPRPFMRPTVAARGQGWIDQLAAGSKLVLTGAATATQVLESVVLLAAGDVAKAISALTAPPLSPLTIARKGSTKPLIETGLMFASVTGVVERVGQSVTQRTAP